MTKFLARAPRMHGAAFLLLALAAAAPLSAQAGDTLDLPLEQALRLAGQGEEVGLAAGRLDVASAAVGHPFPHVQH